MSALTFTDLQEQFRAGTTTPTAVVEACLEKIEATDPEVRAFLEVFADEARAEAAAATERYAAGEADLPPLLGVPYALKNNILYQGRRTTAGSRMLETYEAAYDATVVEKLKAAGAICIGTTNMDEFAMGSSTENSAFQVTKNPRATDRVPGGSSGGSAAAVAMEAVPLALGTDTGGSIRQPASYCGVVGFKPTYGAVSRYGLVAMGSSLDQAGPLTHTVTDAAAAHRVLAGVDPNDATTITPETYPDVPAQETYKIGVPQALLQEGVDTFRV